MKLWIKFLIGAILGVIFSFILPTDNETVKYVIKFITEIVIRFGRYMVVPVVFCSVIIAFNKLRESKSLLKTAGWTSSIIVISSLLLTFVGLISIAIVHLPRIPVMNTNSETVSQVVQEDMLFKTISDALHGSPENLTNQLSVPTLSIENLFRAILPYSAFDSIANGTFVLASFFFAMLIGTASTADEELFRPVVKFFDSFSKLLYNIMVIFTEFLSIGMVAILCYWTIEFREILTSGFYTPIILMLFVDFIIVAGIIYPVILRYLCHDPHPYKVLYASICSIVTAFFSGDANLVLPLNLRISKESLGVRRRINSVTHPLFSVFARGGSALVTTVSFIVIYRSYSSLAIPFTDIMWISFTSFGLSFLLGGLPAGGTFVSLIVLCILYGRNFEMGYYLLLKPAAPILCSFAAAFDVLTAMFGSYIVAVKTKYVEHHSTKHFI